MALLDEYQVGVDGDWTDREARHLWRRAGFGLPLADQAAVVGDMSQTAFRAAIDSLVDFQQQDPYLDQPATGTPADYGVPFADLPDDESDLGNLKTPREVGHATGSWLYRMRYSSQPLQEQLTLFLHDHMVSEADKLSNIVPQSLNDGNDGSNPGMQECTSGSLPPDPNRQQQVVVDLMLEQNDLFRHTGIDDFRALLLRITRNAAMLVYLDNIFNIRGRPQENYAREVMELFSMGVGNYSEQDVREIAKCLTGETFPNFSCENDYSTVPGFSAPTHEPGDKSVFGQTVREDFGGQETVDVMNLIGTRIGSNPNVTGLAAPYNDLPATSIYLSWKLLTWFVSHDIQLLPTPDPIVLELADYMRGSDSLPYPNRRYPYDIRAALGTLFSSKYFYDESNVFTMYKNPAEYVISTLQGLDLPENYSNQNDGPGIFMILMGMRLFDPPNVAGWNHGTAWLNSGSMIARYLYAFRTTYQLFGSDQTNITNLLAVNGGPITDVTDLEGIIDYFTPRLIQEPLTTEEHDKLLQFLIDMPGNSDEEKFFLRVLGIIHLILTMPRFQLK